jgi:hypothetical protein
MLFSRFLRHAVPTLGVVASLVLAPLVSAQTPIPSTPFPQTGHAVDPIFVAYFTANGGEAHFGYPITYAYAENGFLVQYFQNARLEWHPENKDPYKIQLGLLAELMGKRQPPIPVTSIPAASDPSCRYFPETGHKACHLFLQYYLNKGGLDQFGYPISDLLVENDRLVQYFQRARMEYHPGKPEGQRVKLTPLYEESGIGGASLAVVGLHARASVADSFIKRGANQVAFVTVTDQLGNPISGAVVTLTVYFPTGAQRFALPSTNAKGASSFTFNSGKFTPGTSVALEFTVTYSKLTTTTTTSYLVWFY